MINLNENLCYKDRETIEYIYNSFKIINQLYDEKDDLQFKINKAIEYIENHLYMESDYGIQHPTLEGKMNYDTNGFELLEILKGDSND